MAERKKSKKNKENKQIVENQRVLTAEGWKRLRKKEMKEASKEKVKK